MSTTDEERSRLKLYAHENLTSQEEVKLVNCYEILRKMVDTSDSKTLDVLQKSSSIFCFTECGKQKMVRIFSIWEKIKHLPIDSQERKKLS